MEAKLVCCGALDVTDYNSTNGPRLSYLLLPSYLASSLRWPSAKCNITN